MVQQQPAEAQYQHNQTTAETLVMMTQRPLTSGPHNLISSSWSPGDHRRHMKQQKPARGCNRMMTSPTNATFSSSTNCEEPKTPNGLGSQRIMGKKTHLASSCSSATLLGQSLFKYWLANFWRAWETKNRDDLYPLTPAHTSCVSSSHRTRLTLSYKQAARATRNRTAVTRR